MVTCGTGTCPANDLCTNNVCVCQPSKLACGTNNCGTAPDGCGGTIACGPACPAGQTCSIPTGSTAGICKPLPDLCDPATPGASTQACFGQQDKSTSPPATLCSSCVATNCFDVAIAGGPGICETVPGNVTFFTAADGGTGTLVDGKTCAQVFDVSAPVSQVSACLATLDGVFKSGCAKSTQLTPCLCGTADALLCTSGNAQPLGPVYDVYACDFGSTSGGSIFDITTNFQSPVFGSGQANLIAACAGSFNCDCF
jgi:hypothetical protein